MTTSQGTQGCGRLPFSESEIPDIAWMVFLPEMQFYHPQNNSQANDILAIHCALIMYGVLLLFLISGHKQ